MGKRKEIDVNLIKDERVKKLVILALKHDISPTVMAYFLGVSYGTYNRYQNGETAPQSENTRAIIDNIIEKLS